MNENLLDKFNSTADRLIQENGNDTKKALLKTLAYMSGHYLKPMSERSLQFGHKGHITYHMEMGKEFDSTRYAWMRMKKHFPENITDRMYGMRQTASKTAVIFDIYESDEKEFLDAYKKAK